MDLIESLILDISKVQKGFYKEIEKETKHKINYRAKQIDDLYTDTQLSKDFINYYEIYMMKVSELINSDIIDELFDKYKDLLLRVRSKESRSLEEKVYRYKNNETRGKIDIQKCVNDLLGFRVITEIDYREVNSFEKLLIRLKKQKIISRYYIRNDGNYKGIHLYFKNKSNMYLPWELQIWYRDHERGNLDSHLLHKNYNFK